MDKPQRRQQIADYKRREAATGIYLVHCTASEQRWAGIAADLSSIQNRLWFSLRMGNHPHRALQQAWTQHGAAAFQWQVAQVLDDAGELQPFERERALADALAAICADSGATPLR